MRWIVYQRERFPVLVNGMLIAAFSASAMSFSALLRGVHHFPPLIELAAGFASSFIFFAQLRIADEFKDYADDLAYRPYRPVQRGLVTLKELGVIGVAGMVAQLVIALLIDPALALILAGVWAYFALMTKEFFVSGWLKAHPVSYLLSHMFIMPLIDFYVTAFDWLVARVPPPSGLIWFLAVSFVNGIVIEVGRKIRAAGDEERGVETYTVLWGRRAAPLIWLGAVLATGALGVGAAAHIHFLIPGTLLLVLFAGGAALVTAHFVSQPNTRAAKAIELMSGVWTLGMYLTLGIIPMAVQMYWPAAH
jgi:4-hydroxybenzoate polyprenyltransferase